MADDKEDIQNNKDDAQVKNELGAIKAQLTATANPAELARLASAAAGLALSTNNPQLLEQIKGLQAAIAKKEETAEQNISSKIAVENLGTQEQQHDPEVVREQQLHERHESLKAEHTTILQEAEQSLDKKRKENAQLQSLADDINAGKDINPERLQSFIKTPEQINQEHEENKRFEAHKQNINQHHAEVMVQDEKLRKEREELAKQAEEQRKTNEKLPSAELQEGNKKSAILDTKLQQKDIEITNFQPKVQEVKAMKEKVDKIDEEKQKESKKDSEIKKTIKEGIEKQKEANPEKYNEFASFSNLLLAQTEAVKTGEIKDLEQRNKFLGKETNKEAEITFPGKKGSDIILPGKDEVSPPQKPTVTAPSTTAQKLSNGEEALKLAENRPIATTEVKKFASKIQSSLKNQQPVQANNKETQVSKLARTNQQNKKNEGPSR